VVARHRSIVAVSAAFAMVVLLAPVAGCCSSRAVTTRHSPARRRLEESDRRRHAQPDAVADADPRADHDGAPEGDSDHQKVIRSRP